MGGILLRKCERSVMFGRLRVSSCSLSPEQKESYKADFCSLCHSLRDQDGYLSTLLTNYDSTFWLTVASGVEQNYRRIQRRSCTAVPFRSVPVRLHSEEVARSNTALLWMLVRAKAEDDSDDEGSWKAKAALRLSSGRAARGERDLAAQGYDVATLRDLPCRQKAAESKPGTTFADVCAPTQEMMAEAFGHLATVCHRPEMRSALRGFGRSLGTCIYLLDALDDHVEDLKAGCFNPLFFCSDSLTRPAIAELAGLWLRQLTSCAEDLELEEPSRAIIFGAIAKLRSRISSHTLLEGAQVTTTICCAARRRKEAAFCHPHLSTDDPGKDRSRECCSEWCDCDVCECCCEAPDCCESCSSCDCCGSCDCGGCDCGGCDCGGCSCSAGLPGGKFFSRFLRH